MTSKQRYIFLICMCTGFVSPFMSSSMNLSIPAISAEFSGGATTVTWVISAYTLATAVFSIPLGHVADTKGRRRVLLWGSIAFLLTSAFCMLAPSLYALIGGRVAMAIAQDAILASNVSLMLIAFPPENKGKMLGYYATAVAVGLTAGPFVGGVLSSALSWRYVFAVGVLAGAFVVWATKFHVEADQVHGVGKFDSMGSVLFMIALVFAMVGLSELTQYAWAPVSLLIGIALIVTFVIHEGRCESPVMQVRFFVENKKYGRANLAAMLSFAAYFSVTYTMAIYLEVVQGIDAGFAGLIMLSQPIIQAIVSPIAGTLSDRRRATSVASFGVAVISAGLFIMSAAATGMPLWVVVACLVIIGFGNAFFTAPNNSVIMSCVGPERYSEANATITAMRGIGQSLSIVIVSLVLSVTVGNTVLAEIDAADLANAIQIVTVIGGITAVLAFFCSLNPRTKKDKS